MDQSDFASISCRSIWHYTVSALIIWVYGGQVCPLVDSLSLTDWLVELVLIFVLFFGLRMIVMPLAIRRAAYQRKVVRQFNMELSLFTAMGVCIALVNSGLYDFPYIESGLKIVFGTFALGFFMALDMALERERIISKELSQSRRDMMIGDTYFPMTKKFAILASMTAVMVSVVLILVIFKDLSWLVQNTEADIHTAKAAVFKEIVFITAIFLAHIFNIILSYAKNLKLSVDRENKALTGVANGDLSQYVPVSSNDEFGIMARYTNVMIDKLSQSTRQVRQTRDVTIMALATLAETRDNETGDHLLRTQHYVRALALELKHHPRFQHYLDNTTIDLLYKSAPLHDIGKVGIPDNILLKPGKLTDEEFDIMKQHTVYGKEALEKAAENLKENNFLIIAQQIAYSHHEKWDGSGYPLGSKEDTIPIPGRLMAIADVYDALISKRVYKKAFSHEKAIRIINKGRATHFDPDVHDTFMAIENTVIEIARTFNDQSDSPGSPALARTGLPQPI